MASSSAGQDPASSGSEPFNRSGHYSVAPFPPPGPPYARPQIGPPVNQPAPGFVPPLPAAAAVADSTSSISRGQTTPFPPSVAGPPPVGSAAPRPPFPVFPPQISHNQTPSTLGSLLTSQTGTTRSLPRQPMVGQAAPNSIQASAPPYGTYPPPGLNQPNVPPPGLNQQNVARPFSMGQTPAQVFQRPFPGPVPPPMLNPSPTIPTPNNPPDMRPISAGEMAASVSQAPFVTPRTNQSPSPPTSTMVGPPRGPPSFGLTQGSTPATFRPFMPPISAANSGQGFPQTVPSYMPPVAPQAPSFGPPASQPVSQASQYPGIQPSGALDGRAIRGPSYPSPYQAMQTLSEEFESLTMTVTPGSMEASIDSNSLARPSARADHPALQSPSNCHGRYFRLTSGSLPNSQTVAARWHLPIGAVVHPLAEAPLNEEVPVVDFGTAGIIRCRRCRTYINPYVTFIDSGRRWRCNLCSLNNDVPPEYYCPLDANGRRNDAEERPELCQGSVEFIAPAEYMVRPPMPPVYFFLIDVSVSAVKTGMLQTAVNTILSSLDKLPGYPRTQIGFLTFDSTLHFYCLKSSLTQPQMMVVADLDDPFLPMPDDLLVNLSESRPIIEALLNCLPSMFKENVNVESATGPALRAAFMIMSQLGGKLLLFQSTLPSLGVGRLKLRGDDPRIYGTEKESALRNAEDPFYKQMAADFSKFQISVSLYAFSENYIDLASLGTLAKYTAGQVYYYPCFQSHVNGEKFSYELARDLTRETAWEAVLRIRCGKGMRFNTYHGHFLLRSSDLMALPAVDCDKAFALQLTLEESLLTSSAAYFQAALLYTSSNGERRIRIHTLAAPLTSDLNEMYRTADTGSIMMLLSRIALERSLTMKLEDVRQQYVQSKLVLALREYQNLFGAQHSVAGRLIFPEPLKLLPLYCLALLKCVALRGGYIGATLDERLFASFDMMIMSIPRLLNFLYPTMFRLDQYLITSGDDIKIIQPLHLSAEKLDPQGAFFVYDGVRCIVWLGNALPHEFLAQLFGMDAVKTTDLSKIAILEQGNELSKKFTSLLKSLRTSEPAAYQQCILVRQGDQPRETSLFLLNLVEDRTAASIGYSDWMLHIFRQVKQKA